MMKSLLTWVGRFCYNALYLIFIIEGDLIMCTRLFPDIIVAAEINGWIGARNYKKVPEIYVTIEDCISHQSDYKYFGICNVFVGYGDQEWDKRDYEAYFSSFPQYFRLTERGYWVDLEAFSKTGKGSRLIDRVCSKLFTQGTYSPKVMRALGLVA